MPSKYYPIEFFFQALKGKYKIPLLIYLKHAPKRYNQLRKKFQTASERILIKQLKELERDGILSKKITGTKPPLKTEYAMTPYGYTLCSVIKDMWDWGELHYKKVSPK